MSKGKNGKSPGKTQNYPYSSLVGKTQDYTSEGVRDNDIFKLPASDWWILGALSIVALAVRLFRLYQPTSVVFDEVQYVRETLQVESQSADSGPVLAVSRPNTSMANSSWMSIHRWRKCSSL